MFRKKEKIQLIIVFLIIPLLFFSLVMVMIRKPIPSLPLVSDGAPPVPTGAAPVPTRSAIVSLVVPEGKTIKERFLPPEGFQRDLPKEGSFGEWLQNRPLKEDGAAVHYYNGEEKASEAHAAVLDMVLGKRDLQQCADSIIRLRAEYLREKKRYDEIRFRFTNGFEASYEKWRKGSRILVEGNQVRWVPGNSGSNSDESFRKYLDMVYSYSGTISLEKQLLSRKAEELEIGDVFIFGGSPGHCVIVMDLARSKRTGDVIFMVAQGFMPAQEMHVLKNPEDGGGSPWFSLDRQDFRFGGFQFTKKQVKYFAEN